MKTVHYSSRRAFTLVELLVSMAVLVIIVLLISQLTNSASITIGSSGKHMDADTEARIIFNRMAVEFARMLKRPDLDYSAFKQPSGRQPAQYGGATIAANTQSGNDQLAFYSDTIGYGSASLKGDSKAPLSLIAYQVGYDLTNDPNSKTPVLRRMGKGLGWEPDNSKTYGSVAYLPITLNAMVSQLAPNYALFDNTNPDYKTAGSQVFRMEYTYLLKSNTTDPSGKTFAGKLSPIPYWDSSMATGASVHTSANGFRDIAAIVVAIAVMDSTSRVIVNDYSKLSGLQATSIFPDAKDASNDGAYKGEIVAAWNAVVNDPNFATNANIPHTAAQAVRVYQRYFYLNTQQL